MPAGPVLRVGFADPCLALCLHPLLPHAALRQAVPGIDVGASDLAVLREPLLRLMEVYHVEVVGMLCKAVEQVGRYRG